jgi:RND family efflux transporter MFP subunit
MRQRSIAALAVGICLLGCKEERHVVAPAPPRVTVATVVQQTITRTIEATGSVAAVDQVDLVARVPGFLQSVGFADGDQVRQGQALFTIEPLPYQAKLQQAQAQEAQQQAVLRQAEAEYERQSTLGRSDNASRSAVDQALANRDSARAGVAQAQAATQQAAINYTYTRVAAPMNGIVTARLVSVGALVGDSGTTKLATVVALDPVYVNFTLAERDALTIRADLAARGLTVRDVGTVPVQVGTQTETGTPHTGKLDYVAPGIDPGTGTLAVRAVFANADRALLPGAFVRVSLPVRRDVSVVLAPETALGADQGGRYVLAVAADGTVEQRQVVAGAVHGGLREIEHGLAANERVIVAGHQRAVPGQRVDAAPAPNPG